MLLTTITSLILSGLAGLAIANPVTDEVEARQSTCSEAQRIAGAQQFVKTIASHSLADAQKIPLRADCPRNIFLTPYEPGNNTRLYIPLGVDAQSTRLLLVAAATAINAGVPPPVNYTVNANNGSVTADFIQTDFPILPRIFVRQIHDYDMNNCLIKSITTYGFSALLPVSLPGISRREADEAVEMLMSYAMPEN